MTKNKTTRKKKIEKVIDILLLYGGDKKGYQKVTILKKDLQKYKKTGERKYGRDIRLMPVSIPRSLKEQLGEVEKRIRKPIKPKQVFTRQGKLTVKTKKENYKYNKLFRAWKRQQERKKKAVAAPTKPVEIVKKPKEKIIITPGEEEIRKKGKVTLKLNKSQITRGDRDKIYRGLLTKKGLSGAELEDAIKNRKTNELLKKGVKSTFEIKNSKGRTIAKVFIDLAFPENVFWDVYNFFMNKSIDGSDAVEKLCVGFENYLRGKYPGISVEHTTYVVEEKQEYVAEVILEKVELA